MHGEEAQEENARRLRMQRNLLAALAACAIASIALALPRKLANHRELKALNERLVELQASIVQTQEQIRDTQDQIVRVQGEITRGPSK
jgi:hypothetical protein